MNGKVESARVDYGPDYEPIPPPDIEPPTRGDSANTEKETAMDWIKTILSFGWVKGWRTAVIVIFIAGAYVVEKFFGLDIPNVNITWEMVLMAFGIGTAAVHTPK